MPTTISVYKLLRLVHIFFKTRPCVLEEINTMEETSENDCSIFPTNFPTVGTVGYTVYFIYSWIYIS